MARLPLSELPLERFLLPNIDIFDASNIFGSPTTLKRPLSPTGHQNSPHAKRRMISLEDDAYMESPGSSKAASRSRYGPQPVDFDAALRAPNSPVRRLDFSSPSKSKQKQDATDTTPRPRTRAFARALEAAMPPAASQEQSEASSSSSSGNGKVAGQSRHPIVFNLVPRAPPLVQDATSEHFPGFHVCPDPYTVEACVDDTRSLEEQVWYDEEPEKENEKPPREIHGLNSLSLDSPTKSASGFSMSVVKGKTMIPHSTSYISLAHRRIFGIHSAVVEDSLDLGASDSYARRAALASDFLCLSEDDYGGV